MARFAPEKEARCVAKMKGGKKLGLFSHTAAGESVVRKDDFLRLQVRCYRSAAFFSSSYCRLRSLSRASISLMV